MLYGHKWLKALLTGLSISLFYQYLLYTTDIFGLIWTPDEHLRQALLVANLSIIGVYAWYIFRIYAANCSKIAFIFYMAAWGLFGLFFTEEVSILYKQISHSIMPPPYEILIKMILLPFLLAFIPVWIVSIKEWFKTTTIYRLRNSGQGGSASWPTTPSIRKQSVSIWKRIFALFGRDGLLYNGIFIGRATFLDDPRCSMLFHDDHQHVVTTAAPGGGKSINLVTACATGNFDLIIGDPKGQLAMATFDRRNGLGKKVKGIKQIRHAKANIVAPMGIEADEKKTLPLSRVNLLAYLNLDDPNYGIYLSALCEMIAEESKENQYFAEIPRQLLAGFIVHVKSWFAPEFQTLPVVHDIIYKIPPDDVTPSEAFYEKLLKDMLENPAGGGEAQKAAAMLMDFDERTKAQHMTNLYRNIKWLGHPGIRKCLSGSDFELDKIGTTFTKIGRKTKRIIHTIYVVMPEGALEEYGRFLRVFFACTARVLQARKDSELPVRPSVICIDEWARLGGAIPSIANGFEYFRYKKIRIMAIMQDLAQLRKDYPDQYGTILGCSVKMYFAMKESFTLEAISKSLGEHSVKSYDGRHGIGKLFKKKVINVQSKPLLSPSEVGEHLSNNTDNMIYEPVAGRPMRLRLMPPFTIRSKKGFRRIKGLRRLIAR